MKMLLPIIFRDYWNELEDERLKLLKETKNCTTKDIIQIHLQFIYNKERMRKRKQRKDKSRNRMS